MYWKDTQDKEYGHKVNQTFLPPYNPVEISDVLLAFPAHVVGSLLPKWEDMPEEFRRQNNEWTRMADKWFCCGLDPVPEVKEGIDPKKVWRHLKACMGSFEPAHEHKIAGVGYLMSLWLKPIKGAE